MYLFWTLFIALFAAVQVLFGSFPIALFAFPVNAAVAAFWLVCLWVAHREKRFGVKIKKLCSLRMASVALILVFAECVVGGLVPQDGSGVFRDGQNVLLWRLGFYHFQTSWHFVALLVLVQSQLVLVTLHFFKAFGLRRCWRFALVHAGLWLALFCGMAGAPDTQDLRIAVSRDGEVRTAYDMSGRPVALAYALRLDGFEIKRNSADGSPVQYSAAIMLDGVRRDVSVNNPVGAGFGEDIYLSGFDERGVGGVPAYCVLQVVRQPWKYGIFAGILLLLSGVFASALKPMRRRKEAA